MKRALEDAGYEGTVRSTAPSARAYSTTVTQTDAATVSLYLAGYLGTDVDEVVNVSDLFVSIYWKEDES